MTIIDVEHLHKRYGDTIAVDDVSFTVDQGEIFGILGPNGAGKTTTAELITGLRQLDGGTVRLLGLDPRIDRAELRQRVGVQLQRSELPDRLRVWEAIHLYASFYADPVDGDALLDRLGLAEKRNAAFGKLSGGQRQRLSIALALVGNPEIVVLDELTTGLDPQARRATWGLIEQIRDRGVTVLLITHFMEEAERLCDRIAVIDSGRVAALDTPAGFVAGAGLEQRIRFRPSRLFADRLLTELSEVASLTHTGSVVVVSGSGDLLAAVTTALARHQIIPHELRIEQSNLDDAFVTRTGRSPEPARELS